MSIQGPSPNPLRPPLVSNPLPRPSAPARGTAATAANPAPESASLWDLLTPDERTFFQQLATVGQLTYAPGAKPDDRNAAAPTGRRIDVRG